MDIPSNKELAKMARQILDVTRKDLSSLMGYSKQSLYFWEKGTHPLPPTAKAIFKQIYMVNAKGAIVLLRLRVKAIDKDDPDVTMIFLRRVFSFDLEKLIQRFSDNFFVIPRLFFGFAALSVDT